MPRRNHTSHAPRARQAATGPTVLAILDAGTMANERLIRAKIAYPGEAPRVVEFLGTPYGTPGRVLMLADGDTYPVSDPGRFGDHFGPAWVRRFWE